MAFPESPSGGGGEFYPRRERKRDGLAYHRAARFPDEEAAGQAYFKAQDAVFGGPANEVSAYRLIINEIWHVVLLGEQPPPELREHLESILAPGQSADLPDDLLRALALRRAQAIRSASWTERHFRP